MDNERSYMLQRKGSCCVLVALCNARIYFDLEPPSEAEFEELSKVFRGLHGSNLSWTVVAKHLGLEIDPVPTPEDPWPKLWEVPNPEGHGAQMHMCLAISPTTVVNYHWLQGPVIEEVTLSPRRSWIVGHPSSASYR